MIKCSFNQYRTNIIYGGIQLNLDDKFKALSDGTRRKILDLLIDKAMTTSEISEACCSSKPNISQHLNVLKKCNLVKSEKVGMYVYYSINGPNKNLNKGGNNKLLSIKEKILFDIQKIADEKNCEPVLGTDSHDEGCYYVMKDSKTVLSFEYSFRLSSFIVSFEIPSNKEKMQINYNDSENIDKFYNFVEEELNMYFIEDEKKKEQIESIKSTLSTQLATKTRDMNLFMCKDDKMITKLRRWIKDIINYNFKGSFANDKELEDFIDERIFEITSFGVIQELYNDSNVSEILINSFDEIWIEKHGKLFPTDICFESENELIDLARKMVGHVGRRIDNSNPMVDARLPDGTRINVVLSPISTKGLSMTIRKYFKERMCLEDLIKFNSISKDISVFLKSLVRSRSNILVSGAVGSGKTTILNVLGNLIPNGERTITIEDICELQLDNDHIVSLESRPANAEGNGEISMMNCIKNSMRMRPDRIMVDEIRDGSAFHAVQAMNTGYDGSMASVHSNSPLNSLQRLSSLSLHYDANLPFKLINQVIGEAIDVIIHVSILKDGSKKITNIIEVVGYDLELESFILEPIFTWEPTNEINGKIHGDFIYSGYTYSDSLRSKFEIHNVTKDVSFKNTNKQSSFEDNFEIHLIDVIHSFTDTLRSGYMFQEALKACSTFLEEPFSYEFKRIHTEMQNGRTIESAINESVQRINNKSYSFLMNVILEQYHLGGKLEPILQNIVHAFEFRNELKSSIPRIYYNKFLKSKEWEFMNFIEFLSLVTPSSNDFQDALKRTCKYFDNEFSKEVMKAIEQMCAGKRQKDALNDLAKRINLRELDMFVKHINQAETFGTGIESSIAMHVKKSRSLQLNLLEIRKRKSKFLMGFF